MNSEVWVVGTLLTSIILIVFTIVKGKVHPFLALLLASFYVGTMMGMNPVKMVNAMEEGIGGTLGFLAAVIGLGTIHGRVRALHQGFGRFHLFRKHANANAGPRHHLKAFRCTPRLADRLHQIARNRSSAICMTQIARQDRNLVARQAGH